MGRNQMPRISLDIEIEFYLTEEEKEKEKLGVIIGNLHEKYVEEILGKKIYDRKLYDVMMKKLWEFWRKEKD